MLGEQTLCRRLSNSEGFLCKLNMFKLVQVMVKAKSFWLIFIFNNILFN